MRAHHDAIDLPFPRIGKDLVGRQPRSNHHFAAEPGGPGPFGQGFEMLHFGTRGGRIVVIADPRGLGGRDHQRVIGMEER